MTHVYNCTKHSTTGFSPYYLMFGRHPRLPVDICLGVHTHNECPQSHASYVDNLRARLQHAYQLASKAAEATALRNKRHYDARAQDLLLQPGDRVLVRNLNLRGKHKLGDRWEKSPHLVINRRGELPVYKVRPEGGGRERNLYRNLLLPLPTIPAQLPEQVLPTVAPQTQPTRQRPRRKLPELPVKIQEDFVPAHSEEEECDHILVTVHPSNPDAEVFHPRIEGEPSTEASPSPTDVGPCEDDPSTTTRSGRVRCTPRRLIDDPVWSQKAAVFFR